MVDYNLMEYFLKTTAYRQALNGVKQMFIGRKGAGKSAVFQALQSELRDRQKAILVAIAPTDFQFEALTGLAVDQYSRLHPDFVFQTFWRYIIFTEILRVVGDRYSHFLQSSGAHIDRILEYIQDEGLSLDEDFASRALQKLDALQRIPTGLTNLATQNELEVVLQRARMNQIERDLQKLAKDYPIFVVIDDIDKYWNPSYEASVRLLLGLVNETSQMYNRFRGNARVALFLRQDIFEVLRRFDEELVKRNISYLRWDEKQLLQVIATRVGFTTNVYPENGDEGMWSYIFPASIQGLPGWRYMIERTFMRPRDILQFCQLSLDEAQLRGHDSVEVEDVIKAEKSFSEYMLDALRLEYHHVLPELERVIFEFGQWKTDGNLDDVKRFVSSNIFDVGVLITSPTSLLYSRRYENSTACSALEHG